MRSNLPGAAKYVRRLTTPQPCSVTNCGEQLGREDKENGPAHYHTALGYNFCMSHRQRYMLLLLAQRLYPESMTTRETVNQSEIRIWIDLAIDGNDESVEQHMKVHSADLARFNIDERVL